MNANRRRELAAWYANGTLDENARREVETAMQTDPELRDLVEHARANVELARESAAADQLSEVSSALLVQYADSPHSLDAETRAFVESKLSTDPIAREALDLLREIDDSAEPLQVTTESEGLLTKAWNALGRSILSPVPAMAYLLVLAALVPLVFVGRGGEGPAAVSAPLIVEGERALRGEGAEVPVLSLPRRDGAGPAALMLATDLREDDLSEIGSFEVVLEADGSRLWSEIRTAADFLEIEGRASLLVLLDLSQLAAGKPHRIEIRARKPGSPLDDKALFIRRLEVTTSS